MTRFTAILLAAGLSVTAGVGIADSHVFDLGVHEAKLSTRIDTVTADVAGKLMIVDYRQGTEGAILGETEVNAGANDNVLVLLDQRPGGDVLAVVVDPAGNRLAQSVIKME